MKKKGYYIYFYNPVLAKTGWVEITTTSKERAIELFYKNYDETYQIVNIDG